jgi:ATPase subunit of ABC transporter with duplicated ATPase domains
LDFIGQAALQNVLTGWAGGLVVASHDEEFLGAIGVEAYVTLGQGAHPTSGRSSERRPL